MWAADRQALQGWAADEGGRLVKVTAGGGAVWRVPGALRSLACAPLPSRLSLNATVRVSSSERTRPARHWIEATVFYASLRLSRVSSATANVDLSL